MHDHLGDIFASLDAEAFQRCFVAWVAVLTGAPAEVIAIDGKASRRTCQKKVGKAPIHIVSAFAARQRLVLGQVKVADVSVQAQILNLLRQMKRELGLTYVFVSHNLGVIRYVSDTVAVMRKGRIVESGPVERVFAAPQHEYTRELLDAVPEIAEVG